MCQYRNLADMADGKSESAWPHPAHMATFVRLITQSLSARIRSCRPSLSPVRGRPSLNHRSVAAHAPQPCLPGMQSAVHSRRRIRASQGRLQWPKRQQSIIGKVPVLPEQQSPHYIPAYHSAARGISYLISGSAYQRAISARHLGDGHLLAAMVGRADASEQPRGFRRASGEVAAMLRRKRRSFVGRRRPRLSSAEAVMSECRVQPAAPSASSGAKSHLRCLSAGSCARWRRSAARPCGGGQTPLHVSASGLGTGADSLGAIARKPTLPLLEITTPRDQESHHLAVTSSSPLGGAASGPSDRTASEHWSTALRGQTTSFSCLLTTGAI